MTENVKLAVAINTIIIITYCGIIHVSCVPFRAGYVRFDSVNSKNHMVAMPPSINAIVPFIIPNVVWIDAVVPLMTITLRKMFSSFAFMAVKYLRELKAPKEHHNLRHILHIWKTTI